ncbi:hypothetical protein [Rhodococcus wratislaviensis]|uniref:hypothetical protein n=1 Tax=Rhodococcus wratislaviensis TaxID=44752 RepID=UPI0004B5EEDB|nr:hypothetical protein [Rhodococcus wratislaviensis]
MFVSDVAELVPILPAFGDLDIDDATALLLVGRSAATIDRRLATEHKKHVLRVQVHQSLLDRAKDGASPSPGRGRVTPNDGAYVEQKDWAVVLSSSATSATTELLLLNTIWVLQSELTNYFCPQQKLTSKGAGWREGDQEIRYSDDPLSPCRRSRAGLRRGWSHPRRHLMPASTLPPSNAKFRHCPPS